MFNLPGAGGSDSQVRNLMQRLVRYKSKWQDVGWSCGQITRCSVMIDCKRNGGGPSPPPPPNLRSYLQIQNMQRHLTRQCPGSLITPFTRLILNVKNPFKSLIGLPACPVLRKMKRSAAVRKRIRTSLQANVMWTVGRVTLRYTSITLLAM